MIKNKTHIEVKNGEKFYTFVCDTDCLLGEIHDVLCKMKSIVIEKIQEHSVNENKYEKEALDDDKSAECKI